MCDLDVDGPDFWSERWVRARKAHRCIVCRESIRPGDLYHYSSGKWEDFATLKHCSRCWKIYQTLMDDADEWDERIDLMLNCGETYEGEDPEMLELAFMSADEAQPWALECHTRIIR